MFKGTIWRMGLGKVGKYSYFGTASLPQLGLDNSTPS